MKNQNNMLDPVEMAERAIAANLDSSVFRKVDDRDVRHAKNFFDFCIDADMLAMNPGPFARQVQMGLVFFGEWCPRCSRPNYLSHIRVDTSLVEIQENLTMLCGGVCPTCGVTQTELFATKELQPYEEFVMVAGQRASKSALTGMFFLYHLHRVLMLPSPSRYYGLIASSTLHMTLIALTAGQIQDNIWDPFIVGLIDNSPWFHQYHAFLDDIAKKEGVRPLYTLKDTFISYDHKGIILSYSGADFRKLRGRTRIASSIDELGWMDAHAEAAGVKTSGKGQHDALANSLRTIRSAATDLRLSGTNWVPTGIDCNISSPSSANDMIMRLVRSKSPMTSAWHFPTWEVNPKITYESIRYLETEDKRSFDRDFRAEPPMAHLAFMDNEILASKASVADRHNVLCWKQKREQDPTDPSVETMWLEVTARLRDRSTPRILGIDPGETNNSFALVLSSWHQETKTVMLDGVLECRPERRQDGTVVRVNFPRMFDHCIVPILEAFNVKLVVTDHWQSSDMVQRLKSHKGIRAETYALRYEDMMVLKAAWLNGNVRLPATERPIASLKSSTEQPEDYADGLPVLKLLIQALTVREVGLRIVKTLDGTDDIFRAAALTIHYLLNPETNEAFIYSGVRGVLERVSRVLGVRRGRGVPAFQNGGAVQNAIGIKKRRNDMNTAP